MDATDVVGVWSRIYSRQLASHGMGAGCSLAMSGLDMALWDIRGKALGLPCWRFLGGASKTHITAYASLLPTGRTAAQYQESLVAKAREAKRLS